MKNVIPLASKRQANSDIEQQAADWLVKFDHQKPSKQEFIAFMKWYRSNPQHASVYDAMAETWDMSVVANTEVKQLPRKQPWRQIAVAACLMVAVFATLNWPSDLSHIEQQTIANDIAERSSTELADGSVVDVDSNSALESNFDSDYRNIYLKSGQAFFDVHHDKGRPFIVHTPYGTVQAVGTAFNIDLHNGNLHVIVSEGTVAVKGDSNTDDSKVLLDVGHEVSIIESRAQINALSQEEISAKLAWREGRLEYQGAPLSEVMADVARYQQITVQFEQADLKNIAIGGSFSANKIDALLESLEQGFAISHQYDDDGRLILSHKR